MLLSIAHRTLKSRIHITELKLTPFNILASQDKFIFIRIFETKRAQTAKILAEITKHDILVFLFLFLKFKNLNLSINNLNFKSYE